MILSDSQMLKTGYLAQTSHLYWRLFLNSQVSLNPHNISHVGFMSMPTFSKFQNMITRHKYSGYSCYSTMASESEASVVNSCTANTNKSSCPRRSYQVVVAATRDMGIGRDGKLPWNLPSDLKFFKEVTTSTSVAGKRNAVIMGRRTWESIPLKYRPLPGRLNVVLTRSGKLEGTTLEDLLVCCDLSSALKLLAKPSYSLSVEKVFIIGGGQVLKEALNAPGCEAIHLTDVETNIECDTFIPRINSSLFHQSCLSEPMVENNIRFSFMTYVRSRLSAV